MKEDQLNERLWKLEKRLAELEDRAGIASPTPIEHLRDCGSFCRHVDLCEACVSARGPCAEHASNLDGRYSWKPEGT